MTSIRSFFTVTLALLVALTSQQLAVARGQPHAAGQVEICSGDGVIVVAIDKDGNPVGPAHICPDVALAFMAALDLPPPGATQPVHMQRVGYAIDSHDAVSLVHITTLARGPPLSV